MVNIKANGNKIAYGIKHFVLDDFKDLESLNAYELTAGCTAFVIHTSKQYMLDSNKKWYEIKSSGGSSGGGGGSSDNEDIIYEGGEV